MKVLQSATRITLLWLVLCLPILTWFGKVDGALFKDVLLLVVGGFFAKSAIANGTGQ